MSKKTIMITGASRGLGKFLSEYFIDIGHDLILVSSNIEKLKKNIKDINLASTQKLHIVSANYLEKEFEKKMFRSIEKFSKNIDVLINNAATQFPIGPFVDTNFEEWEKNFKVNFVSTALVIKKTISFMNNKSGGSIINISGGGSTSPRPNLSAYACSKTALVRLTETLSYELDQKNLNININAIAPGAMPTTMMKELLDFPDEVVGKHEKDLAKQTLSSSSEMDSVGKLCDFLISSSARNITGKLISAKWDNWSKWPENSKKLDKGDLYTLRRITSRDRGFDWGDL